MESRGVNPKTDDPSMKNSNPIWRITLALALTCCPAATLKAQNLYVANWNNGLIGEYGLDGSTVIRIGLCQRRVSLADFVERHLTVHIHNSARLAADGVFVDEFDVVFHFTGNLPSKSGCVQPPHL